MAIAYVISGKAGPTVTNPSVAAIDTTGCTLFVVTIFGVVVAGTLSDSASNTWTEVSSADPTTRTSKVFYVASPTTSATHTFTYTASSVFGSIIVSGYSGTHTSPLDDQATNSNDSAASLQAGQVDPTEDDELIVACSGFGASVSQSIDGGFTIRQQTATDGNGVGAAIADLIQTSAAAANPTWSYNSSTPSSATILTFKVAAAAAVPSLPPQPVSLVRPFNMTVSRGRM
jgi:hypothetical protein